MASGIRRPARAGLRPRTGAVVPPLVTILLLATPTWAYGAPADEVLPEWDTGLRDADDAYAEVVDRWREAIWANDDDRAYVAARRLRLTTQIRELEARRDQLVERLSDLRRTRDTESNAQHVRATITEAQDRAVQESADAVARAVADLRAALAAERRGARTTRALDAWRNAHQALDWEALLDGAPDPRAELRRSLEQAAAVLNEPKARAVSALFGVVIREEEARRARHVYLLRTAPEPAVAYDQEITGLERELGGTEERLARFRQRYTEVDLAGVPSEAEQALLADTAALRARYAALETALEHDEAMRHLAVSRAQWCALFVHGGSVAYLLDPSDPGALARLRTAASTYGGPCKEEVEMDILPLQGAWSEALFREAQEPPAWALLDEAPGVWTIDGSRVDGPGVVSVRLPAGMHRISLWTDEDLTSRPALVEDYKSGDHVGVRFAAERVTLDVLPAQGGEWVIPVRRQVFDGDAEAPGGPARSGEARSDGRLLVGATWTRFDPSGDYDQYGPRIGARFPVLHTERLGLYGGLAVDARWGEHPYRYTDTWSGRVLLQGLVEATLATRQDWAPQGVSFGVRAAGGTILPANAAILEVGPSVEWSLPTSRLGLHLEGGATLTAWADSASVQPDLLLGISWRI